MTAASVPRPSRLGVASTLTQAAAHGGYSRRRILVSGTLAAVPLLARGHAGAPAHHARRGLRVTTTSNLKTVLARSPLPPFRPVKAARGDVTVSPQQVFQPFLGVGAALTDSAAYVLTYYMTAAQRSALLNDLFSASGRNWQMLRVCMGSPDFRSEKVGYTYDDGTPDPSLSRFSVARDTLFITPVIREILAINPAVKILATPWTPPAWMLASGSFESGGCTFNDMYMASYAQYFVKFVQAYNSLGIPIWAVTAQNEAVGGWFMALSQSQESSFIGSHLGPALAAAGLGHVKIFAMDDQWSHWQYGRAVYTSPISHPYTAGIAYHGYEGSPTVMSGSYGEQHQTEWRSLVSQSLDITMAGMAGGYVAGGVSHWARSVILWNLALDQNGEPNQHKPGRRGVVTVNNMTGVVTRNPEYYALAQLAMFAQPGAHRCYSPSYGPAYQVHKVYPSDIVTTALINRDGSVVLYVYNGADTAKTFKIIDGRNNTGFTATMIPGELSTFIW
jgi:glucosylceramidase